MPRLSIFLLNKNTTAVLGENIACDFLVQRGYKILERNWRYGHSEIDLICARDGKLVFVEVKTRKSLKYGLPETAVSESKQKAIFRASEQYIYKINHQNEIRFDIIGVILGDKIEVAHFEDAFYPKSY